MRTFAQDFNVKQAMQFKTIQNSPNPLESYVRQLGDFMRIPSLSQTLLLRIMDKMEGGLFAFTQEARQSLATELGVSESSVRNSFYNLTTSNLLLTEKQGVYKLNTALLDTGQKNQPYELIIRFEPNMVLNEPDAEYKTN